MKPVSAACALLSLVACGSSSGAGLRSFADSYAASYCHFAYHCCTPSDRGNPENPFSVTASTEETYGFATEQGCATALGAQLDIALQPYDDSVLAKRASYNEADGQSCLSAVAAAAAACDPNAFWATSQTGGACNVPAFFAGLVPGGGDCTMDQDCAAAGSFCAPVDGGVDGEFGRPAVISGAATCVSSSPSGELCGESGCGATSCCSYIAESCVAYVATGATCDQGCDSAPCDPSANYCDVTGTGACQPLIANGAACNPNYDGADCKSYNCVPNSDDPTGNSGTCQSDAPVIQICVGNPNGF